MTFDGKIHEISLKPITEPAGIFKVWINTDGNDKLIYQKRMKKTTDKQQESYFYDGFPDSKFLKVLIRDELSPGDNLGHIDRYNNFTLNEGPSSPAKALNEEPSAPTKALKEDPAQKQCNDNECKECKVQE